MTVRTRSEEAARAVLQALGADPTDAQKREVVTIIERLVIDAMMETNRRCVRVAKDCCSADRDMAHKLAEELEGAHLALIANLSSMR